MSGSSEAGALTRNGAVEQLAALLGEHDLQSLRHSWRVGRLAEEMAASLGVPPEEREAAALAGLLHDVGKIGIPTSLLGKPCPLSDEEAGLVRSHAPIGGRMVRPLVSADVADAVRDHHERVDGGGYPAGLRGGQLSWMTRVVSVADTYDALVSQRPYRRGCSKLEAFLELRRVAGTQLDEGMVDVLIELESAGGQCPGRLLPGGGLRLRPLLVPTRPL
ncbi:MAG TPA: HD domain-containing phosphohydrolase [Actinomycetota bacterium]|nr:HD domain-containing phosphohydrolase [Actinomycetota bacterium]